VSNSPYIIEINEENWQSAVLEQSRRVPVLVDFWASWCQPCQMLMPILAKLAEEYQGKFVLAKVNTEEQQNLAAQFGIRSIPTVKLFKEGRPVDEFAGALPESEIRRFLDRHIPRESDAQVERARSLLLQGDAEGALKILEAAKAADPTNVNIDIATAQAKAAVGDASAALGIIEKLPLEAQQKPEVQRLKGLLHFEAIASGNADPAELAARLEKNSDDHEARRRLAARKVLEEDYEAALELLLELMRRDRKFGDDAARRDMVAIFDLLGEDPLVSRYRSRMMNLLY